MCKKRYAPGLLYVHSSLNLSQKLRRTTQYTHTHLHKNETLKIILNDMNRLIFNWEATSATLHVHPEFVYTLHLWIKNAACSPLEQPSGKRMPTLKKLGCSMCWKMLKDHSCQLVSLMSGKMFLLQKAGKTLRFWKVDPQSPTNRATQASSWLQPEQPTICGPPCILQPLVLESKASRDAVTLTGWVQPWHSKKSKEPRTKYEHIKGSEIHHHATKQQFANQNVSSFPSKASSASAELPSRSQFLL